MGSVSGWEMEKERVKAKPAGKSHGGYSFFAMAQGDVEDRNSFHRGNKSFAENYFVLTGGPLWATMRALRGHFGLGGMGNPLC